VEIAQSFFVIIGELFPETCVVLPASSAGRSPSSLSPAWQSLPVAGLPPAFLAGAGYGVRRRLFFRLLIDLALLEMVGAAHSLNPALAASQPRTGDTSAAIQRP
jgi:hypothetical protein